MYIDSYNSNLYISCLDKLSQGLAEIEDIYNQTEANDDFKNIDSVINFFDDLFNQEVFKNHLIYKVERIYKSLYLSNPGPHTKGNSYWHINLQISSKELTWLDEIYNLQIQKLLKLYKHSFSKIDNFLISLNPTQIWKYQKIISDVRNKTNVFLEYSQHREIVSKRNKLDPSKLIKIPFGGLFYTAHIDNIKSILEIGILSHNLAYSKGLVTEDISNRQVNERRNRFEETLQGSIHDYAPLYFNPRNPMLYYLCKNMNKSNLVLLKVNPHILMSDNVVFSDGNAAVKTTSFYKDIEEFNKLNWNVIKDKYWTKHPDGKRIMCSEVLVRDKIPMYYITDLYTYNQNTLEKILPLFPNHFGIKLSINDKLYF